MNVCGYVHVLYLMCIIVHLCDGGFIGEIEVNVLCMSEYYLLHAHLSFDSPPITHIIFDVFMLPCLHNAFLILGTLIFALPNVQYMCILVFYM